MLSKLRRTKGANVFAADGRTIVASLKDVALSVVCWYAPCSHRSTVALCDAADHEVAFYCSGHGRQALREYGRAIELKMGSAEDSAEVA